MHSGHTGSGAAQPGGHASAEHRARHPDAVALTVAAVSLVPGASARTHDVERRVAVADPAGGLLARDGERLGVIRFLEPYSPDPARPRPAELGPDPLASVMTTFRADPSAAIVFRTPRPEAIPAGAREVAAQVASGFEAGDVDRIAALATPTCWLWVVVEPGGGSAVTVSGYVAGLRTRFAAGLRVRADPTLPAAEGSSEVAPSIRSEWTEGGRTFLVYLHLREVDGRWYWGGLYQLQPR